MEICKIDIERLKNFKLRNKVEDVQEINIVLGGNSYTFSFHFVDWSDFVNEDKKKKR